MAEAYGSVTGALVMQIYLHPGARIVSFGDAVSIARRSEQSTWKTRERI